MDDKNVIACTANEKYVPLLRSFINSIQAHNNTHIHATLINCETSTIQKLIKEYNSTSVNFVVVNKQLSTVRSKLSKEGVPIHEFTTRGLQKNISPIESPPRWCFSEEMAYCSNIRFKIIKDLLDAHYINIIYSDVDMIVRKGLNPLFDIISQNDIVVKMTKDTHNRRTISQPSGMLYGLGLIGVHNSSTTLKFFEHVQLEVFKDMDDWDADNIVFHQAIELFKPQVKNMPVEYKDSNYHDESFVWCGGGSNKFFNEKFNNERKQYE